MPFGGGVEGILAQMGIQAKKSGLTAAGMSKLNKGKSGGGSSVGGVTKSQKSGATRRTGGTNYSRSRKSAAPDYVNMDIDELDAMIY